MFARPVHRYLARQFARPRGLAGRWIFGAWLDRIGRPMNRLAFERLDVAPGDRVIEVGFGGGDLLRRILAATSGNVAGVDASEAMTRRAKRRFRREIGEGRLRVLAGSAERLPFRDGAFDKACSVNSIYFWSDPAAVMAEFARVLRPGGRLVLGLQTPKAVRSWPGHRYGFRAYGADRVAAVMEEAGLVGITVASASAPKLGAFLCVSSERP